MRNGKLLENVGIRAAFDADGQLAYAMCEPRHSSRMDTALVEYLCPPRAVNTTTAVTCETTIPAFDNLPLRTTIPADPKHRRKVRRMLNARFDRMV